MSAELINLFVLLKASRNELTKLLENIPKELNIIRPVLEQIGEKMLDIDEYFGLANDPESLKTLVRDMTQDLVDDETVWDLEDDVHQPTTTSQIGRVDW